MITINDKKMDWTEGMTVTELFKIMNYNEALIAVTIDRTFIRPKDYNSYKINDNASIKAIHICHGG